jgi:hypothetical protein
MSDDRKLVSRIPEKYSGFKTSDGAIHEHRIDAENAQRRIDLGENLRNLLNSNRHPVLGEDELGAVIDHMMGRAEEYVDALNAGIDRKKELFVGNWKKVKDAVAPKVGSVIKIQQSSSGPPAVWTEVWTVTRVERNGDITGTLEILDMRKFDGWEMR